ncbi:hypothetical protein AVEN_106167-1 [Araneus ventricosus]|uniref:RNase H type-1 domain-containing protein n=1 Tax=Araneus ventricosus TaxID=182803 RepID=A0A4Y2RXF0_ARAVE|nr:hypothetical protein AVEN_95907-1 [Araneus ventricosus]GBN80066.1 hypothetical protein AVEN_134453-1 [Araneus ventricosus]GBO00560.1 hypothetical protein AVEN_252022-1 [Araneus ventricosus]GBO00587.1 hypothetical protein AVEN_106167-1 [Araneus ventricosus]
MSLQDNPDIEVGLVKANIGIAGNEATDELVKKATKEGPNFDIPAPKSYIKKLIKTTSLQKWQADWNEGETGRLTHNTIPKVSWNREVIQFATGHGPFPWFNLYHTNRCDSREVGDPRHFATSCALTVFHMLKPSDYLTEQCRKSCLSNKYSRFKIIQLENFLTDNEVLFYIGPWNRQ